MKICAIITAGGTGSRTGLSIPKQFVEVNGKPIVWYTLKIFENIDAIDGICLVVNDNYRDWCKDAFYDISKLKYIVSGGMNAQESRYLGLKSIQDEGYDRVLIHDGVRPFITETSIMKLIESCPSSAAVICNADVYEFNGMKYVPAGLNTRNMALCSMPVCFDYNDALKAYEMGKERFDTTSGPTELLTDRDINIVSITNEEHMKVTYGSDIDICKKIL